ncbi:class I SAM-dependent methyltransferase [Candidatus Bathyarchaeota archaeon]|nr:class I SAM-dependent methyltransferase [Candidatus Bathyarchaeota archaeon]
MIVNYSILCAKVESAESYFKRASVGQTGAIIDESKDKTAVERRFYMMQYSKPKGKNCLSLGCGLGRFVKDYIAHKASLVVGVDLNKHNLLYCKKYEAALVLADVQNLPFKSGTFGIIDCEAVTCHLPNPEKALKEIKRISKHNAASFVDWHIYRWIDFHKSRTIRFRIVFYIRDLVMNALGLGVVIKRLTYNKNIILRTLAYSYGNYRNAGFTFKGITSFYEHSQLMIKRIKIYEHVVFITSHA